MPTSSAHVTTDRPGRYAKQLVSHMTRRVSGEWDETAGAGWLQFDAGRATLQAGEERWTCRSTVPISPSSRTSSAGTSSGSAPATSSSSRWTRDDGSAGTEQRNDADE